MNFANYKYSDIRINKYDIKQGNRNSRDPGKYFKMASSECFSGGDDMKEEINIRQ